MQGQIDRGMEKWEYFEYEQNNSIYYLVLI